MGNETEEEKNLPKKLKKLKAVEYQESRKKLLESLF
jgi:hypothetical protein